MRVSRFPISAGAAALLILATGANAQIKRPAVDSGNRLNNPFRTQFSPAWATAVQDPVKLIEVGPVTDSRRSNLVLLVAGSNAADTQRKIRVLHWNGTHFDTDAEVVSQSIGIDSLLLGRFHPGTPVAIAVPVAAGGKKGKPATRKPANSRALQILTNSGIYVWADKALEPLFARQLPDVKQAIVQDNRSDTVVVGAGDAASAFEFTQTEMRPAAREKLQGGGYAHFGIGLQSYPGAEALNLAPGIRFVQSMWQDRAKWLVGLVRGQPAGTAEDPGATMGDRIVVYTPKFPSRDKNFWETRMDDLEEAWRSDPLPGRVLDVRIGDPHNDGKPGILVLTAEDAGQNRRLTFFAATAAG